MQNGEKTRCPACGEMTIVRTRPIMQDWQQTGEEYYCIFCEASLGLVTTDSHSAEPAADHAKRDALAALLGGDEPETAVTLDDLPGERRFCRDCRHYVRHPFHSLCGLHDRETDPMSDCSDYARRTTSPAIPEK